MTSAQCLNIAPNAILDKPESYNYIKMQIELSSLKMLFYNYKDIKMQHFQLVIISFRDLLNVKNFWSIFHSTSYLMKQIVSVSNKTNNKENTQDTK